MNKFWKEAKDYILIIIAVLIIRTFIVTPAIVDGASMDYTLEDGQLVFINKFVYNIKDVERFDIVVLNNEEDNDRIIKRIIGLPNETIEYNNNQLYVNGKLVEQNYEVEATEDFTVVTKENEYFVLGDNRDVSKDSRMLGNFNEKDIIGRVNFRILPFKKFGSIQ
jgi:signal peptidase I